LRTRVDEARAAAVAARAAVVAAEADVRQLRSAFDTADELLSERRSQRRATVARLDAATADLARLRSGVSVRDRCLVRPATGELNSEFGMRRHPVLGHRKLHSGTDFRPGDGRIYAAADGVVVAVDYDSGYGRTTKIDHGTYRGARVITWYAHQASTSVEVGDTVAAGEHIGRIGSTGMSTGPHLHFEVRLDDKPVQPRDWLAC
jgi:murein DD-endopeptidase MepM/ murein hydrolase activator NlpD